MSKLDLESRMKRYEYVSTTHLMTRTPVIIRIDGRAFHTFTHKFIRPFDWVLMGAMDDTMKYLCEHIPGCVFGYKQSDEITLVLVDYTHLDTEPWFRYSVQKMCSVVASMATLAFQKYFILRADYWHDYCLNHASIKHTEKVEHCVTPDNVSLPKDDANLMMEYYKEAFNEGATFDTRVFNIPKDEVLNELIWRQQDARRNSIQMVGQLCFSPEELYEMDTEEIINQLQKQHQLDWNDYPTSCKLGTYCRKENVECEPTSDSPFAKTTTRMKWVVHEDTPLFLSDPNLINSLVFVGE